MERERRSEKEKERKRERGGVTESVCGRGRDREKEMKKKSMMKRHIQGKARLRKARLSPVSKVSEESSISHHILRA